MVNTNGQKWVGLSWPSTTVTMPLAGLCSLRNWVYVVGLSIFGRRTFRAAFKLGSHSRTLCMRLRGKSVCGWYKLLRLLSFSILNSGR